MRSCTSPFTLTATAANRSRSPMDRTTSDGSVPTGTVRVAPSGRTRVTSACESGRSIMLWASGGGASAEQRRQQPGISKVENDTGQHGDPHDHPEDGAADRHGVVEGPVVCAED